MDVTIRKATLDDYDTLNLLFDEIDTFHRQALPYIFLKPSGPARAFDYYDGLVANENIALLVAESGGLLVGVLVASVEDAREIPILVPRRYVMVDTIVVRSGFQRQGIGELLMEAITAWAAEKGAGNVELSVYEFNQSAIAFYHKLGYTTLRRIMTRQIS